MDRAIDQLPPMDYGMAGGPQPMEDPMAGGMGMPPGPGMGAGMGPEMGGSQLDQALMGMSQEELIDLVKRLVSMMGIEGAEQPQAPLGPMMEQPGMAPQMPGLEEEMMGRM